MEDTTPKPAAPAPAPEQPKSAFDTLIQGEAMVADMAAKAAKAKAAVDDILAHVQQVHDAMLDVSPALRADLMYVYALLTGAKAKL